MDTHDNKTDSTVRVSASALRRALRAMGDAAAVLDTSSAAAVNARLELLGAMMRIEDDVLFVDGSITPEIEGWLRHPSHSSPDDVAQ